MRYIYTLLILLINSFVFAQDAQLFEGNWYLTNLIENGTNNYPPINNITLSFNQSNSSLDTDDTCNSLTGITAFQVSNFTDFSLSNSAQTLLYCAALDPYETKYFQFFQENGQINNFTYTITQTGNSKILTINSMFSKQAIYSNQLLANISSEKIDFSISPNPSTRTINVKFENDNFEKTEIEIYNSLGKLCKKQNLDSNNSEVDIDLLSSGVYFVKVLKSNKIAIKKLIRL